MIDIHALALGDAIVARMQSLYAFPDMLLTLGRSSICRFCPWDPPATSIDYVPASPAIYNSVICTLATAISALYEHARVFARYGDIRRLLYRVPRQELQLYSHILDLTQPPASPQWLQELRLLPRDTIPPTQHTWDRTIGGVGCVFVPSIPHCLDRNQPFLVARVSQKPERADRVRLMKIHP